MDNKQSTINNQKNQKSIYVIGISTPFTTGKKLSLKDITILTKHPEQLTYSYVFTDKKPDKKRLWQISVQQNLSGLQIDNTEKFSHFVNDYFSDQNSIEQGMIPQKLDNDFYVFSSKKEADEICKKFEQQQQASFNNLFDIMKPYAPKQRIFTIDLIVMLAEFVPELLQDITNDPKAIGAFMKNVNQIKPH